MVIVFSNVEGTDKDALVREVWRTSAYERLLGGSTGIRVEVRISVETGLGWVWVSGIITCREEFGKTGEVSVAGALETAGNVRDPFVGG